MPGLSGTQSIELINKNHPFVPIIMITQSLENETIENALGLKVSDYSVSYTHLTLPTILLV